jgi:hypothetical protein
MNKEYLLYGCQVEDLDELIADAMQPYMGEHYMLAMSMLSDAQELLALNDGGRARQYINRAKYVLSHWKDCDHFNYIKD